MFLVLLLLWQCVHNITSKLFLWLHVANWSRFFFYVHINKLCIWMCNLIEFSFNCLIWFIIQIHIQLVSHVQLHKMHIPRTQYWNFCFFSPEDLYHSCGVVWVSFSTLYLWFMYLLKQTQTEREKESEIEGGWQCILYKVYGYIWSKNDIVQCFRCALIFI